MPSPASPAPMMDRAAVSAFLDEMFPQIHHGGPGPVVESVGPMTATMRLPYHERHLRPGGTISGPAMMGLADVALYVAILAQIGPVALAVTTNLSFNFMRKPAQATSSPRRACSSSAAPSPWARS